jgi:adenylate cyclase
MMRAGIPSVEIGEEMEGMVSELIPFVVPLLGYVHDRPLSHFIEQDLIGHMEAELGAEPGQAGPCGSRSPSPTSPGTPA